ncbi:MAG: YhjD/YihY/BrkB family envelope integrity protein, partial [Pseudomonadota bacterium]
MNRHVQRIRWLFGKGLWDIRATERPWLQAAGIRTLRMATASVVNFKKDDGLRRASGLTFYTLLSVVPILALLLGVAKGFGFENHIEKQLLQYLRGQEEVVSRLI